MQEIKLLVQPCSSSWFSLKSLCLSKQPSVFSIAPSSLGCLKICQGPRGEDLNTQVKADWKPGPQAAAFKSMQIYTVLRIYKHKPCWPPEPGDQDTKNGYQMHANFPSRRDSCLRAQQRVCEDNSSPSQVFGKYYSQSLDMCLIGTWPSGHSHVNQLMPPSKKTKVLGLFILAVSWGWQPFKNSFSVGYSSMSPMSISPTDHQSQIMKRIPLAAVTKYWDIRQGYELLFG